MANIKKIKLGETTYNLRDDEAIRISGDQTLEGALEVTTAVTTETLTANTVSVGSSDQQLYTEAISEAEQALVIENKQSKVKFYHSEGYNDAKLVIDDREVLTTDDIFGSDILLILDAGGADVQLATLDKTKLL